MNKDNWELDTEECTSCEKPKQNFYKCDHCWGKKVCTDCVMDLDGKPACPDCYRKANTVCRTCGKLESKRGCAYFKCKDCGDVVCYYCSYYKGEGRYEKENNTAYCPSCFVKKEWPGHKKAGYVLSKYLHSHGYRIEGPSGHEVTIDWKECYGQLGFLIENK